MESGATTVDVTNYRCHISYAMSVLEFVYYTATPMVVSPDPIIVPKLYFRHKFRGK